MIKNHFIWFNSIRLAGQVFISLVLMTGCNDWSVEGTPSPSAIPVIIDLAAPATTGPTPTGTPMELSLVSAEVTPMTFFSSSLLPTYTPSPTPTSTPTATSTPIPTPTWTPTIPLPTITPTVTLTPTMTPPVPGAIFLVSPEQNTTVASNINEMEFKWKWQVPDYVVTQCSKPPEQLDDNWKKLCEAYMTIDRCESLPGYGFEVRIWPARDGFGPLGAMDAALNQKDSLLSCNPDSDVRTYTLKYLHEKPGVKAGGAGKFLWDAALVHLKPYEPVVTPIPRLFEISFEYHGSLDPSGADLSCSDFNSWQEAQAVFIAAGGPGKDPHGLDPDKNQIACDELRK